jgi:galactokinase
MTVKSPLIETAISAYRQYFEKSPEFLVRAPGRVNLIGEHTDYNNGFVLPCAISAHTIFAIGKNNRDVVDIVACDLEDAREAFPTKIPVTRSASNPWSDYFRGVFSEFQSENMPVGGMNVTVASSIPHGAGLSSSAALEVGFAAALVETFSDQAIAHDRLAQIAQRAENNFVGLQCGIMDQLASACGIENHALLIDCMTNAFERKRFPDNVSLMIVHSGVKHTHVGGEYNQRRKQCEQACAILEVDSLRQASMCAIENSKLSGDALKRARHVVSENQRTLEAADALERGDLKRLGELMNASQDSMRDDFEITTSEIDELVSILQAEIGQQGGARMTGGGFGGCVVAIFPDEISTRVRSAVIRDYFKGQHGIILEGKPEAGLSVVQHSA